MKARDRNEMLFNHIAQDIIKDPVLSAFLNLIQTDDIHNRDIIRVIAIAIQAETGCSLQHLIRFADKIISKNQKPTKLDYFQAMVAVASYYCPEVQIINVIIDVGTSIFQGFLKWFTKSEDKELNVEGFKIKVH